MYFDKIKFGCFNNPVSYMVMSDYISVKYIPPEEEKKKKKNSTAYYATRDNVRLCFKTM